MGTPRSVSPSDKFCNWAAPCLILMAPVVQFLSYHQYGLARTEVIWLLIGIAAVGGLLAVLMRLPYPSVRLVLMVLLITIDFDILVDIDSALSGFAILAGTSLFVWILREHVMQIVTWMALVFVITTLVFPNTRNVLDRGSETIVVDYDRSLPPVLHIILDEHIGIEGIPLDIAPGALVKAELREFYADNGFLLYEKAFAQYQDTQNSLSNALNLSSVKLDNAHFEEATEPFSLHENAYLKSLSARGYRIRVYQSDFLDFCEGSELSIASCVTYASNSIKSIEGLRITSGQKAAFIFHSLLNLSAGVTQVRNAYNTLWSRVPLIKAWLPYWVRGTDRVGPLPVMPVFSEIERDIVGDSAGTTFFAHLNIPHYPYVFDRECTVIADTDQWLYPTRKSPVAQEYNNRETRKLRYSKYLEQVRCVHKKLGQLIGKLRETGRYDDWTVIIHGDHGSRITYFSVTQDTENQLRRSDYIHAFSTIFAIKAPGVTPGFDEQPGTLTELIGMVLSGDLNKERRDNSVFLVGESNGKLARKPMPPFSND